MYREKKDITRKLIKYCCKRYKKSDSYTRLLALGINEVEFDIKLLGTHFEELGLKFIHISGILDDKKEIVINKLEYDIDIAYLMYYDKYMNSISVFYITSLNKLSTLVNEELEFLFDSNVYLDCELDEPIVIYSDIEYLDYDMDLSFVQKIKELYDSKVCLKGTFKLRLNTMKFLEKKFNKTDYLNNLLDDLFYILIDYSDFSDIVFDLRYLSNRNLFYSDNRDERVFISNYVFDYMFSHISNYKNPYNTHITLLLSDLDENKFEFIKDNILSSKKLLNNFNFYVCDNYLNDDNFNMNVLDYIELKNNQKKLKREKYQKINII